MGLGDTVTKPLTPLLMNQALQVDQAQRQNKEQMIRQNQQQFKNNMTKLKFLFDSGMKSEGFGFAQGFLGDSMGIDFNKFASAQEDTQKKVASILSKSADTIFDDKIDDVGTASHLDNAEFSLKMLSEQASPVGGTQQQEAPQAPQEQIQPQAPVQGQQQVQQPQQAQITPQKQIQALRDRSFQLNSIKGTGSPEQNLQIEAELKQNEGIISDLTRQIPQASASKGFVAEDIAERISRELFGANFASLSQPQQKKVNARLRAEKKERASLSGGITPTVKTQIQKDIIAGEKTVGELNQMQSLFSRGFLEFKGQSIAAAQKFADKLGGPEALGKDVRQFARDKSAFVAQSKAFQNAYRKWVTGVAGSQKEFSEILKAIPDVDRDGPDMFESKLEQTNRWSNIVTEWLKFKDAGIPMSISDTEQQLISQGVIGDIGGNLTPEQEADKFLRGL